ncbi:DHH family phosphoesterase [Sphingomonas sp. MMS24-JH45]
MQRLAAEGASLIVTVDCGAQAFDALDAATVDVLVVDHHQCATRLPRAVAVVNSEPARRGRRGAHGHLAAVGVCFLLAAALVRELRARGFFASREEPKLLDLLDLVALGTVADVAQFKGLNRAFVAQGLKVMAGRRNVGLAALIEASRLTRAPTCADLGFALGPRDQRRRARRAGGSGRATADHYRRRRSEGDRDRTRPAERGAPRDPGIVQEGAEAMIVVDRSVVVVAGSGWTSA